MTENTRATKRRLEEDAEELNASNLMAKRTKAPTAGSIKFTRLSHREYTIGWISAIFVEFAAAQALLDEVHDNLPAEPSDNNIYKLGRMGDFNIAIACLGDMGMNNAATVANNMVRTFTAIRLQLVVGVAGGVPTLKNNIRLGDVVVGTKVIQHDFGKSFHSGRFQNMATVHSPSNRVKGALTALRAEYDVNGSRISAILDDMRDRKPQMKRYTTCAALEDTLYERDYEHAIGHDSCDSCDASRRQNRSIHAAHAPGIHFGTIASGNQVIKNAKNRDTIGEQYDALCIEMEGAALTGNDTAFLVIRGICDYADSHKNKQWQPYAAATAAACAKEFISFLQPDTNDTVGTHESEPLEVDLELVVAKRQLLMDSLKFDQIDKRQMNIKDAHAKTCKWLLEKTEFQDWLNVRNLHEHHGLLWIKGKPGTGKSTIMKFVCNHLQWQDHSQHIVTSFFFNARGDRIEKSVDGMYRSLLFQLLNKVPRLRGILDSIKSKGAAPTWSLEMLQPLLQQAIQALGQDSLLCFIDALDECNPNEVRDMVFFLEDLGLLAIDSKLKLHICFASRHYPHITVRKAVELILDCQEGHEQDISEYIDDKLRVGTGRTVRTIREQLQAKANGIFMWVVLVVKILNEHSDRGLNPAALLAELERLPQDLHQLFRDILQRDTEDRDKLLLCIQWVLFASRPLGPKEIYLAIHSGLGVDDSILGRWDPEEITSERVRLFILSASKGLVEITTANVPTVQFIHESINDFFLRARGICDVWPDLDGNFAGYSHDKLKSCCLHYIDVQDSTPPIPLKIKTYANHYSKDAAAKSFELDYPFIQYAVNNILWHAQQAQTFHVAQFSFVQTFSTQLPTWRRLNNSLYSKDSGNYESDVSLLYLFADKDLPDLIITLPAKASCLTSERSHYHLPLFAAIARKNFRAVQVLVNAMRKAYDDEDDGISEGVTLQQVTQRSSDGNLFMNDGTENPIWRLAIYGNVFIFDAVFNYLKLNITMEDEVGQTLLHWTGSRDIVTYLVKGGADINAVDMLGQTPLHMARDGDLVDQLIQHGAAVDAVDVNGMTPLHRAASSGYEEVARMLLTRGAMVDARDLRSRTPFLLATEHLRSSPLAILMEFGASTDFADEEGNTPLHLIAGYLHIDEVENIIVLLIKGGAMINARNNHGRTPFSIAAESCTAYGTPCLQLLLMHGAAMDCPDASGQTPLDYAAGNRHVSSLQDIIRDLAASVEQARVQNGEQSLLCEEEGHSGGDLKDSTVSDIARLPKPAKLSSLRDARSEPCSRLPELS